MSSISSSKVISPTAYARKEYGIYSLSANQTTGIANTNPIKFDTVLSGNIAFNPATYTWTLKANKTYKLMTIVSSAHSAAGYMLFAWKDITNSVTLSNVPGNLTVSGTHNETSSNTAMCIVTPTTDINVQVLIANPVNLTSITASETRAEITEIDTYTPAVYGGQYAYVSPEMDLSVTGSNTWATTKAIGVFKKTSNGFWELTDLVIYGTVASGARTSQNITIAGIVLRADFPIQPLETATTTVPAGRKGYAFQADGKIYCDHASATTTWYSFGGIIKLNAKPTGYALPSDV